ncbi:MAG: Stk1 family PASTA domain-containing Ser/Thr kinase [Bacillota bacterium]
MIGECLNDRYEIEEKIGEGGMALVYQAKDKLLNRTVAVKVLRSQFATDKEFVDRFKREAQAVASFSHSNIVNIFDIGEDLGTYYIVMENIDGETLQHKIEEEGRLEITTALKIVRQVCDALIVAHRKQIVHCDIKPGNILLTSNSQAKLADFGIARALTSSSTLKYTETVMGSAHYLAPEQAEGSKIDHRTDIYSLGIVLYEMVTGELPFDGDTPVTVAIKHIKEEPTLPTEFVADLPSAVEEMILTAINKYPAERYDSVREMAADIDEILANYQAEQQRAVDTDQSEEKVVSSDTIVMSRPTRIKSKSRKNNGSLTADKTLEDNNQQETTASLDEIDNSDQEDSFWQRNGSLVSWIIVIMLLVGGTVWGYQQVTSYLQVPVVEVPNLVKEDLEVASDRLKEIGLNFEVHNRNYNSEIPQKHIISQYPKAGSEVKKNRTVSLVVSKGAELTKVPKVLNQTLREARVALAKVDLQAGEITREFNDEIPKGEIISQSPKAEEEVEVDSKVDLVISKGTESKEVKVPNLVGLSKKQATNKLQDLDLIVGNVIFEESLNYLAGTVISQEPQSNTTVESSEPINLVISEGLRNPNDAQVHEFRVQVGLEPGDKKQRVKIIISDDNGRRIIYNQLHQPGDLVEQSIVSVGSTRIRVYIDGNLVREKRL